jgi:hypothetical protein
MTDLKKTARVAGLLYLAVVVTGIFSLIYVPSHITVAGDPSATVRNIMASERLLRLGIVVELLSHAVFLVLPFALYKLLRPAGDTAAVLMVALAVMIVPITFVNNINKLNVLSLLNGAGHLRGLTAGDVEARVMLSLSAYANGILVSKVFWGLWLLPFGYLVLRSGFLPRALGILLMLGCLGYLIDFVGRVLFPGFAQTTLATYVGLPAAFGELGICLWLLVVGAGEPKREAA